MTKAIPQAGVFVGCAFIIDATEGVTLGARNIGSAMTTISPS